MIDMSIALSECDRTSAVLDGSIRIEGVNANLLKLPVQEIFNRQLSSREFDASEMAIASYIRLYAAGDCPFVAIPIFPSRFFRQSCIFVNRKAGIGSPADLAGKRVGVPVFDMAAAAWLRGILQDDYGLDPRRPQYLTGGMDVARPGDAHPQFYPEGFDIQHIGPAETLSEMLADGRIDALVTAKAPPSFFFSPDLVCRLFSDFRTVEEDYFKRTGIFPIMHTVALTREFYEAHPWAAVSLYKALELAHERACNAMLDTSALAVSLPWLTAHVEDTVAVMGKRFWTNGIESNRHCLNTLIGYMEREGSIKSKPTADELFAPEVLAYLRGR